MAIRVDDLDRRAGPGLARMRFLDDLGPSDHLLELVDPAVQETDLFLGVLVLVVVLDITRLERLLQALAGLGTPLERDFEIALELLEPLGREQYRVSEVHLAAF